VSRIATIHAALDRGVALLDGSVLSTRGHAEGSANPMNPHRMPAV
jgi:hypothetical protein